MRVIVGTGHRPEKFGGFDSRNPIAKWARSKLFDVMGRSVDAGWTHFISGGALAWDQWIIEFAFELGVGKDLIIAKPYPLHGDNWPGQVYGNYMRMQQRCLEEGGQVINVTTGHYTHESMQQRNRFMVDSAHVVMAGWDGSLGGTKNCVDYARQLGRPIYRIDPHARTVGWIDGET